MAADGRAIGGCHARNCRRQCRKSLKQLLADPDTAGNVYDRFLQQVEPPLLATVMGKCGKRFAPAARVLGLHRTTLKKKLTQYEIEELVGEN